MLLLKPDGKNERHRIRLMARQVGRCRYCERLLNMGPRELLPILDHFLPRSSGGKKRDLVVACHWCDKAKGMIHGADFIALIQQETVGSGRTFNQARAAICRKAKAKNIVLQHAKRTPEDELHG